MAIEPKFKIGPTRGKQETPSESGLSNNLVTPVGTAIRVRIRGRVQGVFFRGWAVDTARAMGVAGWVRNRLGGSVEAHFEGSLDAVEAMIARCREGPLTASVDVVEPKRVEAEGCIAFHERPTV